MDLAEIPWRTRHHRQGAPVCKYGGNTRDEYGSPVRPIRDHVKGHRRLWSAERRKSDPRNHQEVNDSISFRELRETSDRISTSHQVVATLRSTPFPQK